MEDVNALAQERTQLFKDLYRGKVPKRIPIGIKIFREFALQYAGMDVVEGQWNPALLEEAFDKLCRDFVSDQNPAGGVNRFISYYKMLGSRTIEMSSNGFLQHPEVHGLEPDEYDEFIASPFDCMVETILPRLYNNLNTDSSQKAAVMSKAMKTYYDEFSNLGAMIMRLNQKYGYATSPPNSMAFSAAPFDFVSDFIRGFTGISVDIKRYPEKVVEACEAVTPIMVKMGTPANPSIDGQTTFPLHMAPFLKEKEFEKFYWPTFKKVIESLVEKGQGVFLFIEHDWTRFLDYLKDLPDNLRLRFEYGDPREIKDKLGDKHILTGLYPISILKTGTREECVDKAKELIDIMAPGGKYYFDFDKPPITLSSINPENLKAVLDYVYNCNYY